MPARRRGSRHACRPALYLTAAGFYQDALREQTDLNDHYRIPVLPTKVQLTTIKALLQTAQSHSLADDVKAQAARLFDDLRQHRADKAAATISALTQKAAHLHEIYPLSTLIDAELQQRLDFLEAKRDSLAAIQDQVQSLLLPVPSQKNLLLAEGEVSQALYSAVAGGGKSPNQGPKLPVESVNWNEAQLFCKRLSWILARPVRLPTIEEFHAALGSTSTLDLAAISWNFDNSNGETHETGTKSANPAGFFDLLGNVAEWLEPPPGYDDDIAPPSLAAPPKLRWTIFAPFFKLDITSRNPFTGFRFVVDTDDSIPVMPAALPPAATN